VIINCFTDAHDANSIRYTAELIIDQHGMQAHQPGFLSLPVHRQEISICEGGVQTMSEGEQLEQTSSDSSGLCTATLWYDYHIA